MEMIDWDWPAELKTCQRKIAELEQKIASQRQEIQGLFARKMNAAYVQLILTINERNLKQARGHKHLIEMRLAARRPQPAPARGRSLINPPSNPI
jgi:hypothetical protein